jgi:hypothetical protein
MLQFPVKLEASPPRPRNPGSRLTLLRNDPLGLPGLLGRANDSYDTEVALPEV